MKLYILFGIGDFRRIKQILNISSQNIKLFAYEPDTSAYDRYKSRRPVDKRLIVHCQPWECDMTELLASMFKAEHPTDIFIEDLDGYKEKYPEKHQKFHDSFNDAVEIYGSNIETRKHFDESYDKNIKGNMDAVRLGKNILHAPKIGNVAYIIAAGSSLDKNIDELKNAHGIIISTDTGLKPLISHGIKPHMSVSVDANKSVTHYDSLISRQVPLVAYPTSNMDIVKVHKGTKYFILNENSCKYPDDKVFKNMPRAMSCGSVTSDAMHVAVLMGYKKIVFVGLDLAYTEDKTYAKGTVNFGSEESQDIDECVGINGEMIRTTKTFNIYRKWIERYVKYRSDIDFYDCTEGGALIAGTKLMTLRDFINEVDK